MHGVRANDGSEALLCHAEEVVWVLRRDDRIDRNLDTYVRRVASRRVASRAMPECRRSCRS